MLKSELKDIINTESDAHMSPNILDKNNYLLSSYLQALLLDSFKCISSYSRFSNKLSRKVINKREGVYIIAIRVLNNEKKSLVYSYIYYNDELFLSLLDYFIKISYFINETYNE